LSYERRRTPHSVRHFVPGAAVEAAQPSGQGISLPAQGNHSGYKVHISRHHISTPPDAPTMFTAGAAPRPAQPSYAAGALAGNAR